MADVNSWLKGDSLILVPPTLQHDFLAVSGRTAILFRLEVLDALNLITAVSYTHLRAHET